jgi:uncharacterized protein (TIGR02300 family)
MASKASRGTKRSCQNSDCGARFYDLNRDPITCPICYTLYKLAVSQPAMEAAAPATADKATAARKGAKKPEFVTDAAAAPEVAEGEELVAVEDAEETAADDDTFLEEEEEEGGDVSNIIGGPVAEEGEEP